VLKVERRALRVAVFEVRGSRRFEVRDYYLRDNIAREMKHLLSISVANPKYLFSVEQSGPPWTD
jgi:hypothetical protein